MSKKTYGARIRLTPDEVGVVQKYRDGKVKLMEALPERGRVDMPKILLLDIETAPLTAFLWRLRTEYVNYKMLDKSNWWMISWSAKWLFDTEIKHDVVTSKEALLEDDERVSKSLWHLVDEADVVISHNGKNFDHKMMNMRWMVNGLYPPTPFKIIDTYQVARSAFLFPSYSLNYIATELGFGGKLKHEGAGMWKKCILGDAKALKNMAEYNDQDVAILEDVYLLFRPWIKNHPNIGLYTEAEEPVCATCGSRHVKRDGHYHTSVSKFKTFRCEECGSISRQRQNQLPKELRKRLMTGIPGTV